MPQDPHDGSIYYELNATHFQRSLCGPGKIPGVPWGGGFFHSLLITEERWGGTQGPSSRPDIQPGPEP